MKVPEKYRITTGFMGTDATFGNNGFFYIPELNVKVIASDGQGWEHVSVSLIAGRGLPTWETMCKVKDMFWGPDETVVQYHPKKSEYKNLAEVLHLWKKSGIEYELPPSIMVAP